MRTIHEIISSTWQYVISFFTSYTSSDFQHYALGVAALLGVYYGRKELSKYLVREQLVSRLTEVTSHNIGLSCKASELADIYSDKLKSTNRYLTQEVLDEWVASIKELNRMSLKCTGQVRAYCMLIRELSVQITLSKKERVFEHDLYRFAYYSCYHLIKVCKPLIEPKSKSWLGSDASGVLTSIQKAHLDLDDNIHSPITKLVWEVLDDSNAKNPWRALYLKIIRSNISLYSKYLWNVKIYVPPKLTYRQDIKRGLRLFSKPEFHLVNIEKYTEVGIDTAEQYYLLTYANVDNFVRIGNRLKNYVPINYSVLCHGFSILKVYDPKVYRSDDENQTITYRINTRVIESSYTRLLSLLNWYVFAFKWRKQIKTCNKRIS